MAKLLMGQSSAAYYNMQSRELLGVGIAGRGTGQTDWRTRLYPTHKTKWLHVLVLDKTSG